MRVLYRYLTKDGDRDKTIIDQCVLYTELWNTCCELVFYLKKLSGSYYLCSRYN